MGKQYTWEVKWQRLANCSSRRRNTPPSLLFPDSKFPHWLTGGGGARARFGYFGTQSFIKIKITWEKKTIHELEHVYRRLEWSIYYARIDPPGHYFDFYIVCTIYLNGTNCMRMSLNFVPLVVHCILNMLFPLVKLFVANGDEHPHYSWKKRNTTQQYCSLLVPPGAASNCRKGVSILYLFNTIWRKIQVYLVRILGPFHWQ